MDLAGRLQQLEELVREAKSMPLSSSALLNRDEVLEMLAEMQESLPEEIKQARWIVKDREELLAKARQDGGAHRGAGPRGPAADGPQGRDRRIAPRRRPTASSRRPSSRRADARGRGRGLRRRQARRSSRSRCARSSRSRRRRRAALAKTLDQVEVGRDRLRAPTTAAEQEFGGDPEAQLFDAEEER